MMRQEKAKVNAVPESFRGLQEIEGFPQGDWRRMLSLSEPPRFTLFPNPDIPEIIRTWKSGSIDVAAEQPPTSPATFDVASGKDDRVYKALNYHTKVPPLAILPYILHYTRPGDIVLDPFAGTGMTGVAASLAGEAPASVRVRIQEFVAACEWGNRNCILGELSPAATSMARAYNFTFEARTLGEEIENIASEMEATLGALYATEHTAASQQTLAAEAAQGTIDYVIWSDVLVCPECSTELVYWDAAIDPETLDATKTVRCMNCHAESPTRSLPRAFQTELDPILSQQVRVAKQVPVRIYYTVPGSREKLAKAPDEPDLELLTRLRREPPSSPVPVVELPRGLNTDQPRASHGIRYVHQFYTPRSLRCLAFLDWRISRSPEPLQPILRALAFALHARASRRNRHLPKYGHRHVGVLSGTLYIPPLSEEPNVIAAFRWRGRRASQPFVTHPHDNIVITTQSATDIRQIPTASVDYVFTDPPFGGNINYSELNILWEAWLGIRTNIGPEAIVNSAQGKALVDYLELMARSFTEIHRVLKPGHWMTLVFHNSQNSVWNAIQKALERAGLVVASVHTLDKVKGTIKQLSTANAVKMDLVISVYKPPDVLEEAAHLTTGQEAVVWSFVREHLARLPVALLDGKEKGGAMQVVQGRSAAMLYDKMVAFHVQRGIRVPMSAPSFYDGLSQRFPVRDGMYFLPEQVAEYDRKRRDAKDVVQLQILVTDEASAIQWLRQELTHQPQTFQELHPNFIKEIAGWQKHEKPVELRDMLKENFARYDGEGEVPTPIHAYLSSNFKELPNLPKNDPLREKAKGRWYVPDPRKAGDLEKIRERELLKEFATITSAKGRIRQLRTEAARVGFKTLWEQGDYKSIVDVASKLPRKVVEEDPHLLMYVDLARSRLE